MLDVYRVSGYSGTPKGREQQALAWSLPGKLATYPMPPADRPVVAALTQPSQYLITPAHVGDPVDFLKHIERVLLAGIRRIQLRVTAGEGVDVAKLAADAKRLATVLPHNC